MEARKPRGKTKKHAVRRKRTMQECSAKPTHRRKFHRKKKGILSEMFPAAAAENTAKTIASVVVGGLIGEFLNEMMPKQSAMTKLGISAVAGFLTGTMLKMPALGAGMVAPSAIKLVFPKGVAKKGVSEATQYLSEDELKSLPAVLSEMNLLSEMNPLSENAMQYASGISNW